MIVSIIEAVGFQFLHICHIVGKCIVFLGRIFKTMVTTRPKVHNLLFQMHHIGVESLTIVILTGSFTGLALALQIYLGFHRFGADNLIGTIVSTGMIRELGPVLTALMVTARAGSAMAAELATMRVSEQIDALKTLCIDPFRFLLVPRIVASCIMMPLLTIFSMTFGLLGGYIFCVYILNIGHETYVLSIQQFIDMCDVVGGLVKASTFGFILSAAGTYCGYYAHGGAQGVGNATTQSVVGGSILILISNYFLSSLLFDAGV